MARAPAPGRPALCTTEISVIVTQAQDDEALTLRVQPDGNCGTSFKKYL